MRLTSDAPTADIKPKPPVHQCLTSTFREKPAEVLEEVIVSGQPTVLINGGAFDNEAYHRGQYVREFQAVAVLVPAAQYRRERELLKELVEAQVKSSGLISEVAKLLD